MTAKTEYTATARRLQPTSRHRKNRTTLALLLLALPALIYLFVNNYIPMMGIFIAFKNLDFSKGIFRSEWCGLDNFKYLFQTKDAWIMTRNTVLYNLVFIVLGTVLSVMIAIFMCEILNKIWSKLFQSALVLPNLISMIVVAYIAFAFLSADSGLINNSILKPSGKETVNWYMESKYWPFILTIVQLWKTAGYSSIVYIASISGIDRGLYEAARLDGAGKMRQIFDITLPMIRPTIIMMVLLSVGRIMSSDFGLFYQVPMNSGALYPATQTIDTYVYRGLMQMQDFGMSSAAALYQSVVGFILVLVCNGITRKLSSDEALF